MLQRMLIERLIPIIGISALLSACGGQPDPNAKEVDDFAARIGTPKQAEAAPPASKPEAEATKLAANPENEAVAQPAPSQCNAPKVAPFYGRQADEATQAAVMAAVAPQTDVRFIEAGSALPEDTASPRLNVMIDVNGNIREARCG